MQQPALTSLVYPNEKPLFITLIILSVIFWLLAFKFGGPLIIWIPILLFILFTFAQSAFVCHVRSTGATLTAEQFPDLYALLTDCCQSLEMEIPLGIIINGNGILNAFATQFVKRKYVILFSDIVDALQDDPAAIKFYIGHELGHLKREHILKSLFTSPGDIVPIAGAAYKRAREYTADQHGLFCSGNRESAMRGLAALAVGTRRWASLNLKTYLLQQQDTGGFWMSFHELLAHYPRLVKRMGRLASVPAPSRNVFAWILAAFVPNISTASFILIYFVFVMGTGNTFFSLMHKAATAKQMNAYQHSPLSYQPAQPAPTQPSFAQPIQPTPAQPVPVQTIPMQPAPVQPTTPPAQPQQFAPPTAPQTIQQFPQTAPSVPSGMGAARPVPQPTQPIQPVPQPPVIQVSPQPTR
jgi:hypothetical protein